MKALLKSAFYTTAASTLALPAVALAAGNPSNPFNSARNMAANVGNAAGVEGGRDLPTILGGIINIMLGFVGILLLVYLIYGGFLWMTSGGSEDGAKKAKTMITNAIIGLLIVVAAFALSTFVLGSLINVTQQ